MKTTLIALGGEIRKSLLTSWTYRMNSLATLLTMGLNFVGIGFMMTNGSLDTQALAPMFLGFITWMYAMMAIGNVAYGVRGEMSAGTLEQMAMSPAPLGVILLGALFNNLVPYTSDQAVVQRYLTTRDQKRAANAIWAGAWLSLPASILFFSVGTVLFAFYRQYPERLDALAPTDQIFAWFIVNELPAGVSGLLLSLIHI